MNIAQKFLDNLLQKPERILFSAISSGGHIIWQTSHTEILEQVLQILSCIKKAGIVKGERVAISFSKNSLLVPTHIAILAAGAVVVPLNSALTEREMAAVLDKAEVSLAIVEDRVFERVSKYAFNTTYPWWVKGESFQSSKDIHSLAQVLGNKDRLDLCVEQVEENDLALMLFTSGTTGRPKGVGLSHKNIAANLQSLIVEAWKIDEGDKLLHALPVHHIHGLGLGIYGTLYAKNSTVFLEKFDPTVVVNAVRSEKVTLFMGVPTMYSRILDVAEQSDFTTMRLFVSGSAPLSTELFRKFQEKFGITILERYGLTETIINSTNPLDGIRKAGTVGLALNGVEIEVFDPETFQKLSRGQTGEVWIRGANVFAGYWRDEESTKAAFHHDWFRTGDLGVFDEDGYLKIVGRIKELIIVGGSNISPSEVEIVFEKEPYFVEYAVAGLPDADLGEKVALFAVLREGEDESRVRRRLQEIADKELAAYKRPREYLFVESLPRNAMGKVERGKLKYFMK
ncbi:MAG: AMP-binding protein [Blastocatellia bacterium]|nr:AMP-binding protein [Blastocatellia bacterium]